MTPKEIFEKLIKEHEIQDKDELSGSIFFSLMALMDWMNSNKSKWADYSHFLLEKYGEEMTIIHLKKLRMIDEFVVAE